MEKLKIGFFGDSFCHANSDRPPESETYIKKIEKYYQAEIVNLGVGGSSILDILLIQLDPFIKTNTIPDVCIFVWTEHSRIFHKIERNINSGTSKWYKDKNKMWSAANKFYDHLFDEDLSKLQYKSALEYFDNNILSKFPATTNIIHLWSYGDFDRWKEESFELENIKYLHTWKHGTEIRPPLITFALNEFKTLENFSASQAKNHLEGQEVNNKVFDLIKSAIDGQICIN
jgi:hypothetical protein